MVIRGCLVDRSNSDPLMFVRVEVQGTPYFAVADSTGCFSLVVPEALLSNQQVLLVDYVGYETFTRIIRRRDLKRVPTYRIKRRKFETGIPVRRYKG
jgi:thioredoxin-related protein